MPETDQTTVNAPQADVVNVADEIDTLEEAVPVLVEESKKGYKTTEFWLTVVTGALVAVDGIPAPDSAEGYILAALVVAYAVARGLAKKGTPHVPAD